MLLSLLHPMDGPFELAFFNPTHAAFEHQYSEIESCSSVHFRSMIISRNSVTAMFHHVLPGSLDYHMQVVTPSRVILYLVKVRSCWILEGYGINCTHFLLKYNHVVSIFACKVSNTAFGKKCPSNDELWFLVCQGRADVSLGMFSVFFSNRPTH